MIELREARKSFNGKVAVDGISFTAPDGKLTVLIGPSGCGKSTTLRMINRLIRPDSGEILVQGKPIESYRLETLRRGVGYVIQSIGLFPHLTVEENIGVVPRLLKWKPTRISSRVDEMMELIELDAGAYRKKYPRQLSGGEAQRIGVARALAADPPILLMDEPFGAVDPLNREALQRGFMKIQRELAKTVLFVTHDLNEAVLLADRIVLMNKGRIIQDDLPETMLERPATDFVRSFVGEDRALKRLSLLLVADFMSEPRSMEKESVPTTGTRTAAKGSKASGDTPVWIVSQDGRLTGYRHSGAVSDRRAGDATVHRIDAADFAVDCRSNLRQALSRLLADELPRVPVVDENGVVVGEIGFREIEGAAIAEGSQ